MKTFLTAKWQNLIMANYEIDPDILIPYLPEGVKLDYFQGKTYVSLVGFLFKDSSIFNIPIPALGTFEVINLRFYVVRKVGKEFRRGVVFINETVPNKIVAWIANKLYKEHYTAIPTKHQWNFSNYKKELTYRWKVDSKWNSMQVVASSDKQKMESGSIEEFIYEHYYGYTRAYRDSSIEYKINHPSWDVNKVYDYQIDCDFAAFYGENFASLNSSHPHSVLLAEGSNISVDWKRISF